MEPFVYRDGELVAENVPLGRIAREVGTPVDGEFADEQRDRGDRHHRAGAAHDLRHTCTAIVFHRPWWNRPTDSTQRVKCPRTIASQIQCAASCPVACK